jgi:dolichol-phosphate mannosyltransferase
VKILVVIPTYNEVDSIASLTSEVLSLTENVDILVVDDNSPDGTARLVKDIARAWPDRVRLIERTKKTGLGGAYRTGFAWFLKEPRYTHVVTMDADHSHRPQDLSTMIAALAPATDLVMGVRWMPGGAIINWPKSRQRLSRLGTSYARWSLKLPLRDLTGGFRIYSRTLLEKIRLNNVSSEGYCFQIEMARASAAAQAKIIEVPITFVERRNGVSKMSKAIVLEALIKVTAWALDSRFKSNADKLHYVK